MSQVQSTRHSAANGPLTLENWDCDPNFPIFGVNK